MEYSFIDKLINVLEYNPNAPLLFNSGFFLFFFLFVLIFNRFFLNNKNAKILFLTISSVFFYYKSSGMFFFLVIISSLIDYYAAKYIHEANSQKSKKTLLIISLISNLGILGYFKYSNFFINNANQIFSTHFDMLDIFLPVGVSFFTFQSMSYTIDVYRGNLDPEKKFLDFLFFVSFFPQLVAGPIVRASDFLPQIHKKFELTKADMGRAMFLILGGLFKKAVIADYISINFVDRIFDWPSRYTGVENLLGLYGYAMQLYCDFSGYSDMAIGLAIFLGFKLPDNFNAPYRSSTMTEVWRRWHISLSTWLKDYLYITLGGNQKGKKRTYVNLLLTMLLGGLWHGAAWNFVIWGGIHGTALAGEKFFGIPQWVKKSKLRQFIGALITFHIWTFSLLFFRSQSTQHGLDMINQIINYFNPGVFFQFIEGYSLVFILMTVGYLIHFLPKTFEYKLELMLGRTPLVGQAALLAMIVWFVAQFKSTGIQPFIYFQF